MNDYRLPTPAEIVASRREWDAGRRRWPERRYSDSFGTFLETLHRLKETPVEDTAAWFSAPPAIQAAWRRWVKQGGTRTSDAFTAGWHAANAHQSQVVAERLERIEALLTKALREGTG